MPAGSGRAPELRVRARRGEQLTGCLTQSAFASSTAACSRLARERGVADGSKSSTSFAGTRENWPFVPYQYTMHEPRVSFMPAQRSRSSSSWSRCIGSYT